MCTPNFRLKQSGVYLGSERKQHALCKELIGDNLEVELAPFSFKLPNGGEVKGFWSYLWVHTKPH